MNKYDSRSIKNFFTANSRDLTPASAHHAATILYAAVSRDPEVTRDCTSVLSDTERVRADRFVKDHDRIRFIQRRAFRRFCGAMVLKSSRPLEQIVFKETEKGRPYLADLPDVWFSFSSCRFGFLGAWSLRYAIGVDIEDQTGQLKALDLANRYFSKDEANAIKKVENQTRLRTFFRLWSLKEAALKSIGQGLPFGLDAFEFELAPVPRVVHAPSEWGGPKRFKAYNIQRTAGSCAALVIRKRT
jgi:phosphopantetheinyl transferase